MAETPGKVYDHVTPFRPMGCKEKHGRDFWESLASLALNALTPPAPSSSFSFSFPLVPPTPSSFLHGRKGDDSGQSACTRNHRVVSLGLEAPMWGRKLQRKSERTFGPLCSHESPTSRFLVI